MVAEGVEDASDAPAVLIGDGIDDLGANGNGMIECDIRIFDDHDDARGAASQRFRAEILMLKRLVGDPKLGSGNGKLRDNRTVFPIDPVKHARAESGLIELNGLRTATNRKHRLNAGFGGGVWRRVAHSSCPVSASRSPIPTLREQNLE
jgi:hypothetical protein